jgi:hypothetical protein
MIRWVLVADESMMPAVKLAVMDTGKTQVRKERANGEFDVNHDKFVRNNVGRLSVGGTLGLEKPIFGRPPVQGGFPFHDTLEYKNV